MWDSDKLQLILSVAGFAISVGGLVQVYFMNGEGEAKKRVLVTTLTILVGLSGIAIYAWHRENKEIKVTSDDIVTLLQEQHNLTVDQIYAEIYPPRDFSLVNESLEQLVKNGTVRHRLEEFNLRHDGIIMVRVYSPSI